MAGAALSSLVENFLKRRIPAKYCSQVASNLVTITEEHPDIKENIVWIGSVRIKEIKGFNFTEKPSITVTINNYVIYQEEV
jgi:hypothetical protein